MTEEGNMAEDGQRWGILVKVSLPGELPLWRWSCGMEHVPYEYEQSQQAERLGNLQYGQCDMAYRVYRIRCPKGQFINESNYVKDNGDLH